MDYNKLRTFTVVAELGSISKAASSLHRTQSAISQQIQALEEDVGFGLLERSGGRVYLTPEGRELHASASESLSQIDRELSRLRNETRAEEGLLRVGVISEHANQVLAPRLAGFRARYPNIDVAVTLGTSSAIERALIDSDIDVGILISFTKKELFETSPCAREECSAIAARDCLERAGPLDSYRSIAGADILDFTADFVCMGTWLRKNAKHLQATLARRRPAIVIPDHHALKTLVRAGAGVAVLPLALVARELRSGTLIKLMPESQSIFVTIDLAVHRRRCDRHLHRLFVDFVTSAVGGNGSR